MTSVRSHLHAWNFAHLDANIFRSKQVSGDMWIVGSNVLNGWRPVGCVRIPWCSQCLHTWNFAHLRTYHKHRLSNESGPQTLRNNRVFLRRRRRRIVMFSSTACTSYWFYTSIHFGACHWIHTEGVFVEYEINTIPILPTYPTTIEPRVTNLFRIDYSRAAWTSKIYNFI